MTDIFSKEQRSYIMAKVKNRNTKPEILVRKYLFSHGFRYRLNVKKLSGKPDIVLSKYKTTIFVNGCFWHGHQNCPNATLPQTNIEYWHDKIQKNITRDKIEQNKLKEEGWNVIIIWECQLKKRNREETLSRLVEKLKSSI